jgi:hypothetical protein
MTVSTPSSSLGRHVFGVTALAFGIITLAWHDYNGWHQPRYLVYAAAAALIFGGATIEFRRTAKAGAAVLGLVGLCTASFTLEQAFYLHPTASLVPKWLPPNPMFWAVATTVFFGLAAVALLTNRMALLATRLLTLMLVIFGLVVWVPLVISDPHSHTNWSETAETFAIAGTAWILADLLGEYRLNDHRPATT